ncbi:hypothetical protein [Nostoc sp. CHAB 5715]|uniref:hypothetical protein n=1 Tax=Nostoc sp. CHAB 5715 TaxID=2780400 RepID=UPI001E611FD1|nr:hypothetical protein [Nostoc sp. CHAB 5715]MCC5624127.1 hypothetical protein [Nostoc sp. CHAB 5715]
MGHGEESPMPNAQCPKSAGGYPSPRHLRDGVSRRLSINRMQDAYNSTSHLHNFLFLSGENHETLITIKQ